jgi:type IV pilus assembly protein PilQ
MLGSNSGRFRVAGVLALVAGILACAGPAARQDASANAGAAAIVDVVVESSGDVSRITVLGPEDPIFTAFQQADPDRLIVDLTGVGTSMPEDPISVYDGTVDEISVAPYPTGSGEMMTRVELSLTGAVDYDVRPGQGGLVIEVSGLSDMADMSEWDKDSGTDTADEAGANDDPWTMAEETPFEPMDSSFGGSEGAEAGADAVVAGPATTLEAVETETAEGGVVIHLKGDGMLQSAETFTLDDPARLVIDLPGMKSSVAKDRIDVSSSQVSRVRVGAHADKVRVVIDGGSMADPFQDRRVMPVASGLVVALGAGPAVDDAVAAASSEAGAMPTTTAMDESDDADEDMASGWETTPEAPAANDEAAPAPEEAVADADAEPMGNVMIYGVEFDSQADRDRVVVLGEHPVDYLVYEPDAETVVVSLEQATLDPDAAVRIAPEPGGPVSLVTAFEQPEVANPEVRIVMKRASGLKPEVTRRGSLLMIDFARTGEIAETPPVFVEKSGAVADAAAPATSAASALPMGQDEATGADMATAAPVAPPASVAPSAAPVDGMAGAAPAAMDPPAAISILNEGGLMDGKEYVGRRISLDFKEVEIADVLRLIAEVSDLNVIAGDEVKGKVTIRLVDVPWDQALDVVLLTKGLGFVRIGNVLRIASSDVIAQEEELRLQERRAKEKLEDLVVKLQPVNYADVKDVSKMVKQLLSPRGTVNTDTRTNTLIIKDIASVIDEATALIKAVDTMTPQVLIEAKIVEANLDFSREFGSIWTFGANPATQSTLGGRDWIFTDGVGLGDSSSGQGNNVAFGNTITSFPSGLMNIAASVLDSRFNIEAQLQAAEVNGDGKVISSPRVVTMDNSKAQIEQGVSIPFQTFENGDAQLEFVDAVLQLKTTPHITSDKSIIMEIEVSRNAPDDSVFTLTGSPAIAKNQVKTETLVKDGQTLVLGGIYVVDKSNRQSRVPYLHKVPFIGNAFKSNEISDSRKELLIFVTPRIVQAEGVAS